LGAKADALAARITGGEDLAVVAKELNLDVKNANDVKRVGTTSVPQSLVLRVFGSPVGKAGTASGDGDGRIVFKILDSVTPPFDKDSDVTKAVADQLKQSMADDVLAQYLTKAQADAGVTINQAEVRNAVGLADTGDQ
jgi:peptidyl-prolyl cis-trans isomerase D